MSIILENATRFVEAGIAVIPVVYQDKRPEGRLLPGHSWEGFKSRLPSLIELRKWFADGDRHNYGVVAGWGGLTLIDFDDGQKYADWSTWALDNGGLAGYVARAAYQVITARGVHVYIRLAQPVKNFTVDHIDVKSSGYVLGAGSIHPSGATYNELSRALNFPVVPCIEAILPSAKDRGDKARPAARAIPLKPISPSKLAQALNGSTLVEQVKAAYRIEDFVTGRIKSGPSFELGLCPLHDDGKPSFWLNLTEQIGGCYSGCTSKPVDVIDLYARIYNLSIGDAVRVMASKL